MYCKHLSCLIIFQLILLYLQKDCQQYDCEDDQNKFGKIKRDLKSKSFKNREGRMEVVKDLSINMLIRTKEDVIFRPNEEREVLVWWKSDFSFRSLFQIHEFEVFIFGLQEVKPPFPNVPLPTQVSRIDFTAKLMLKNTNPDNIVIKNEDAIGKITKATCAPYPCLILDLNKGCSILECDFLKSLQKLICHQFDVFFCFAVFYMLF